MDFKGQGAVEYLLILGAAVILAVVVIVTLTSLSATTQTQVDAAQNVDMPNPCATDFCFDDDTGSCVDVNATNLDADSDGFCD